MAEKKYNVAVVGANGAVGEEILTILQEIDFPLNKLVPLASARSLGKSVEFNGQNLPIQELTNDIFKEEVITCRFIEIHLGNNAKAITTVPMPSTDNLLTAIIFIPLIIVSIHAHT